MPISTISKRKFDFPHAFTSFPHSFQHLWKTCGLFLCFTLFFPSFWLFLPLRNAKLLWIAKKSKKWKTEKNRIFYLFFSFFPQEFSTLWLCATQLYKKKEQKALPKRHLIHASFLLAHFYQPFFHTNGHAKNTKIQIHISHFVPFHSFRRHY